MAGPLENVGLYNNVLLRYYAVLPSPGVGASVRDETCFDLLVMSRSNANIAPARPDRRRVDVPTALIAAGEQILERDGLPGLTVRAVAAEAGVAVKGVYNHFHDKEGLLLALLTRAFDRLAEATTWRADLPPTESLRSMAHAYRRFALQFPVAYGLMFGTPTGVEPNETIRQHSEAAFGVLLNAVLLSQQLNTLRSGEPLPLAMAIWSALHGAVGLELAKTGPEPASAATHFESVLDMIQAGLAPKPASP